MKKTKKLLVAFMGAALISTSFTSCIDNGVSPTVDKIYQNQAALIAAQTALKNADVAFKQAETALKAQTLKQNEILNAAANALADLNYAEKVAAGEAAIAESKKMAQQAQEALAKAELEWEKTLVTLQADIAEAKLVQAEAWLADYAMYNDEVIRLQSDKIDKVQEINEAKVKAAVGVTDRAASLLALQNTLAGYEADKAASEAKVAGYKAMLEDPANSQAQKATIEAEIEANKTKISTNNILIAEKSVEIEIAKDALEALTGGTEDLADAYDGAYDELASKIASKVSLAAQIKSDSATLYDNDSILTNYATIKADLMTELESKKAAKKTADDAEEDAEQAEDDAEEAKDDAEEAKDDAQTDFDDADTVLQSATNALASASTGLDALNTALATKIADSTATKANYDSAKAIFEANPNGTTWVNGGATDAILGEHTDGGMAADAAPNDNSYAKIVTVVGGVATLETTYYTSATIPGGLGNVSPNAWNGFNASDVGLYYDVEADDVAPTQNNADAFNAATIAYNTARDLMPAAREAITNYNSTLEDAQEAYDSAKAKFEDKEDNLADAITALSDAEEAYSDAQQAYSDAQEDASDAQEDLGTAQDNLDNLADKVDLEETVAKAKAALAQLRIDMAALEANIVKCQADLDAAQAALDAASSTEAAAAVDALNALKAEKAAIENANGALNKWNNRMNGVINAIDNEFDADDIQTKIDALVDTDIPAIVVNINKTQADIDEAMINDDNLAAALQNTVTKYENDLAVIEAKIALNQSLADKYLDLVNSVL